MATFSDLWLDRADTGYTLTATAGGLPAVTSDPFTVVPGPAAQLTFTAEPSNNVSQGGVVTPPVAVTAFDSLSNKATNFTGVVSLALRQNGNTVSGALSGNTSTAVAGVATFGNLRINNAGAGYTLAAAFGGDALPWAGGLLTRARTLSRLPDVAGRCRGLMPAAALGRVVVGVDENESAGRRPLGVPRGVPVGVALDGHPDREQRGGSDQQNGRQ